MGEERNVYKVLMEGHKEGDHLQDQGVDGIRMDLGETGSGSVD
jgi:hypothetical protein